MITMQRQQDMIDYAKIIKQLEAIRKTVYTLAVTHSDVALSLSECGQEIYEKVIGKINEQYEEQARMYNMEIFRLLNHDAPAKVYFVYDDDLNELNQNILDAIEGIKNRIITELNYSS